MGFRDNITPCNSERDCYYLDHYRGGFTGCRILTPRKDSKGNLLPPYDDPNKCRFWKPADWKEVR